MREQTFERITQEYLEAARRIRRELVADRRRLHRFPEVGDRLPKTTRFVTERLTQMGLTPVAGGPSGLVATIVGGLPGRTLLLRADMDALPMREQSGLSFASRTGAAHTCGHDLHTAMLLGAARLLVERRDMLAGTVKLLFQPDEEGLTGAGSMIAAGVMESPCVEAALGLHVLAGDLEAGVIGVGAGVVMASSDRFRILIGGHGGHGAMPHGTIDPIQTGAHLLLALQGIVARENDAQNPLVITVGSFQAGTAANVIPEQAILAGTVRTMDSAVRTFARKRIDEIAHATAATFRCSCEVVWEGAVPPLVNQPELAGRVRAWVAPIAKRLCKLDPMMGSEDFALFAERVPSVFLFLGAADPDPAYREYGGHHPRVRFNEDVLPLGAAVLSSCAAHWLVEHPLSPNGHSPR